MNPTEVSYQAHVNHKINQYRQEADTERLLREPRVIEDSGQPPRHPASRPLLGRALQLLR